MTFSTTRSLLLAAAALLPALASAQSSNLYVFGGPGGATCCRQTLFALSGGMGGELGLGKGVGAGMEIGAIALRSFGRYSWAGVASPNGYYHFVHGREAKADPFVTAGYTAIFNDGHANLFNFGGGLNYWASRHAGVRVEFRDHVRTGFGSAHYWGPRFGIALR